jgi:hypothetical protein
LAAIAAGVVLASGLATTVTALGADPGAPVAAAAPQISGNLVQGGKLTSTPGVWDGGPKSFAYQWERCATGDPSTCVDLPGATGIVYGIVAADVGKRIRVAVVASNAAGASDRAFSAMTGVVAAARPPVSKSPRPSISGPSPPVVGRQLTANPGNWGGRPAPSFTYQWLRCMGANLVQCGPIPGRTSKAYTPVSGDIGFRLRASVTAHNVAGTVGPVATAPTQPVVRAPGPVNNAKPAIAGIATVGHTLTATPGTWDSPTPVTFAYQWRRCDVQGQACQAILGATQTAYVLQSADVGSTIVVVVTATDQAGQKRSASSNPTAPVAGVPAGATIPVNLVSPPGRLIVSESEFVPDVLRSRTPFTARFRVMDTEGHFVSDADVFLVAIPYGRIAPAGTVRTDQRGWATFRLRPTARFPLVKGYLITFFARATKPGDDLLAGVSGRRLVSVQIRPR